MGTGSRVYNHYLKKVLSLSYQGLVWPLWAIRDWNDLPDPLISSSEWMDDNVSKFISLVRARD